MIIAYELCVILSLYSCISYNVFFQIFTQITTRLGLGNPVIAGSVTESLKCSQPHLPQEKSTCVDFKIYRPKKDERIDNLSIEHLNLISGESTAPTHDVHILGTKQP